MLYFLKMKGMIVIQITYHPDNGWSITNGWWQATCADRAIRHPELLHDFLAIVTEQCAQPLPVTLPPDVYERWRTDAEMPKLDGGLILDID
jgi:hypothetical protein